MYKKTTSFAAMISLAFIFSYIESLIPFSFGIPGVKLGLANLITMIALYYYGPRQAFQISLIRIILLAFTFGSLYTILYSLAGGILSFLAMYLTKKIGHLNIIGVSVAGGCFHNVGQILIASFVVRTFSLFYYLPILIISGVLTGLVIGVLSRSCLKRLEFLKKAENL